MVQGLNVLILFLSVDVKSAPVIDRTEKNILEIGDSLGLNLIFQPESGFSDSFQIVIVHFSVQNQRQGQSFVFYLGDE
ncbi:hypothetical protein D1872_294740 [compost metagenome]